MSIATVAAFVVLLVAVPLRSGGGKRFGPVADAGELDAKDAKRAERFVKAIPGHPYRA
jgi:hypothetical protein